MRDLKIILVGKIQKPFFREAFAHYLKRVRHYIPFELVEIKEIKVNDPELRRKKEGELILNRMAPKDLILAMDEQGRALSSRNLAADLVKWEEDPGFVPCFVIGGAYGMSEEVKSKAIRLISLGPMTLPHELAAVVLMEQIYRGFCINRGHPYHH